MGQIVSSAAKPKRCNLNQLSQVPTPAAGEHILVSSDNSMNAAGQGNFDCYIVGNGRTAATALELKNVETSIGVFDISSYHATGGVLAKYADLTAALNDGNNIPQSFRKGGMSVKFVQSSDNKYVQYRLMATSFSTTESDWQGVDDEPTAGSKNLVKSGGTKMVIDKSIVSTLNKYSKIFNINLLDIESANIIDNSFITPNYPSERIQTNDSYCISDYIPFTEEMGYLTYSSNNGVISNATTVAYALYDKDLRYIKAIAENPAIVEWEEGVCYVRFTIVKNTSSHAKVTIGGADYIGSYTPYNVFTFKDAVVKGVNLEDYTINGNKLKQSIYKGYTGNKETQINETIFDDILIPSGLFFRIKVSPTGTNPGRLVLYYGPSSDVSGRVFDSASNNYNEWITKQNVNDITYIRSNFMSSPQNVRVDIEIPSLIIIGTLNIKDGSITAEKLDATLSAIIASLQDTQETVNNVIGSRIVMPINLLNTNDPDVKPGYYINNNTGNLAKNGSYTVTGYIPVTPGKTYYFGSIGDARAARTSICYNSSKQPISSSFINSGKYSLTVPEGAAYMRCSLGSSSFSTCQVSVDSLKPYQPYFEPYLQYFIKEETGLTIPNKSVDKDQLSEQVSNLVYSKLNHFTGNDTLQSGEYLTLPNIHIQKNNILTCNIEGNISSVSFGVGYGPSSTYDYRDYAALWVTVDDTYVTQYRYYNNGHQQVSRSEHNLTLTPIMKLELACKVSDSYFKLWDNLGNVFEMPVQNSGCGQPFVYNSGSGNLICKLSDYPMDLHKPIWVFGDSYISFNSTDRWPYYFNENGYVNWLSNNQPGLSPETAWLNLQNLISLGFVPKMIVWLLGMNGYAAESMVDGHYVINTYQKTYINHVKDLCERMSIELVFGIVPTVPSRQKTGFGDYVKSLGVRYIDFAYAVGTNELGEWNTGLLSSDNVHPTAAGAKVLASQVMVDCPELTLTC